MHLSTRTAVAVHILSLLDSLADGPMSSDYIAASVNTNPAVIRRILGQLAKAGLVTSQLGTGGGALLARRGRDISLGDVYRAVEHGDLFTMHEAPNPKCPIGRHINTILSAHFDHAEAAMLLELNATTIADVVRAATRRPVKRGA